jgi:hypothetical protein
MIARRALMFAVVTIGMLGGVCGAQTAVPHFTIAASNVTMPSSGSGTIAFTLTSVDGFAGSVGVTCGEPTVNAGVLIPFCGPAGGGVPVTPPIVLTANGTANGTAPILAIEYTNAKDVGGPKLRGHGGAVSWAVVGVLMLGVGLRRRRRLAGVLVVVGMMVGLTALSGCGGPATLTPGVYTYTLSASQAGLTTPGPVVSTAVQVTVPAGIVVKKESPVP